MSNGRTAEPCIMGIGVNVWLAPSRRLKTWRLCNSSTWQPFKVLLPVHRFACALIILSSLVCVVGQHSAQYPHVFYVWLLGLNVCPYFCHEHWAIFQVILFDICPYAQCKLHKERGHEEALDVPVPPLQTAVAGALVSGEDFSTVMKLWVLKADLELGAGIIVFEKAKSTWRCRAEGVSDSLMHANVYWGHFLLRTVAFLLWYVAWELSLNLRSWNEIEDEGCTYLARAVGNLTTLQLLNLQ